MTERRFECTGCGKCCYGNPETHTVRVDDAEQRRIARYLGLSPPVFRARHVVLDRHGQDSLSLRTGRCEFLTPENKCAIYDARPLQCSAYPHWPSLLTDDAAWEREKARCEGMGRGPVIEIKSV